MECSDDGDCHALEAMKVQMAEDLSLFELSMHDLHERSARIIFHLENVQFQQLFSILKHVVDYASKQHLESIILFDSMMQLQTRSYQLLFFVRNIKLEDHWGFHQEDYIVVV